MTALEQINPATLTIDANVRSDVKLDKAFVASVKEHGVIQPVVAHRTDGDALHVLYGQRRTLAAVETSQQTIPVYVVESIKEADRLTKQVVENDHRQDLNDHDRAEAFHQLSLLGVSATQIAKKTGTKKVTVDSALKVKANDTATAALASGMTLEMAAVIDEFSDDADATARLETIAAERPERFAHAAQRLRDDRHRDALITTATAELEEKGLKIVDRAELDHWEYKGPMARIRELCTKDGEPLTEEDADAAYASVSWDGNVHVTYINTDWKAAGFTKPGAPGGKMTDEEKAERRRVIENNKAWDAAEAVRIEFVKNLLKGKTAPKNAIRFVAHATGEYCYLVAEGIAKHNGFAAELLGGENGYGELAQITTKPTGRHETNLLAIVLAGFEKSMSRQSWRHPNKAEKHYLNQLAEWGYTLSDVEQIISGHRDTETQDSVTTETQ